MSTREEKDCQWRRYSLCNDLSRFRKLWRSSEDISHSLSRDCTETFNNQSKGGAGGGGNGGVGGVGGAVGATGTGGIMMDGSELEVGDHTTTDFAYAHHGNGTAPGEY